MDNDNTAPVFTVGTLPKKCYTDPQELLNDFAAALSVPTDTAKVIHGAQGEKGDPGDRGQPGDPGPPGPSVNRNVQNFEIPAGAEFIDIPLFTNWQFSTFNVLYNGLVDHPSDPDYGDLDTVVGIGTIVPKYGTPDPTILRVYFIFMGAGSTVPDENHLLSIVTIS